VAIIHNLEQIKATNVVLLEELGEHAQQYLQVLQEWKANPTYELRGKLEAAAGQLKLHAEVMESSLELEDELSDEE
jgi:flagellar biosynthesis/type III secretory pathway chaperone